MRLRLISYIKLLLQGNTYYSSIIYSIGMAGKLCQLR